MMSALDSNRTTNMTMPLPTQAALVGSTESKSTTVNPKVEPEGAGGSLLVQTGACEGNLSGVRRDTAIDQSNMGVVEVPEGTEAAVGNIAQESALLKGSVPGFKGHSRKEKNSCIKHQKRNRERVASIGDKIPDTVERGESDEVPLKMPVDCKPGASSTRISGGNQLKPLSGPARIMAKKFLDEKDLLLKAMKRYDKAYQEFQAFSSSHENTGIPPGIEEGETYVMPNIVYTCNPRCQDGQALKDSCLSTKLESSNAESAPNWVDKPRGVERPQGQRNRNKLPESEKKGELSSAQVEVPEAEASVNEYDYNRISGNDVDEVPAGFEAPTIQHFLDESDVQQLSSDANKVFSVVKPTACVKLKIHDQETWVIINQSSSVSLVSDEYLRTHTNRDSIAWYAARVAGIKGVSPEMLETKHCVELQVTIPGLHTFTFTFHVIVGRHSVIIGEDLLRHPVMGLSRSITCSYSWGRLRLGNSDPLPMLHRRFDRYSSRQRVSTPSVETATTERCGDPSSPSPDGDKYDVSTQTE